MNVASLEDLARRRVADGLARFLARKAPRRRALALGRAQFSVPSIIQEG